MLRQGTLGNLNEQKSQHFMLHAWNQLFFSDDFGDLMQFFFRKVKGPQLHNIQETNSQIHRAIKKLKEVMHCVIRKRKTAPTDKYRPCVVNTYSFLSLILH